LPFAADCNRVKKEILIRTTYPLIRVIQLHGKNAYQVDARRKGTNGKRKTFVDESKARTHANKIEQELGDNGKLGLAMSPELRTMAQAAEKMLAPFDKTILQAADFYRAFLEEEKKKANSALVPVLAKAWYADKASGKLKVLRAATLKDIKATSATLCAAFDGKRILDITVKDILDFLNRQEVGYQRLYNIKNLFAQFFNWCVKKKHCTSNPCDEFEIEVESKSVSIFTPAEAEALLRVCETTFPGFILYHAISIFAGLRPEECQFLSWGADSFGGEANHGSCRDQQDQGRKDGSD
jgi:hypothetical protein